MSKLSRVLISATLLIALACALSGCGIVNTVAYNGMAAVAAEGMAASYIQDKYGIAAQTLGHNVQTGGSLIQETQTTVVVPMRYEDTEFCVYLDMLDPSCRYDNYQREQVGAALEDYLLAICNLPQPAYSTLDFDMGSNGAGVGSATHIVKMGWSENETFQYDSSRMIDFKYDGQSGEELLSQIADVYYKGVFVSEGNVLESMAVPSNVAAEHSQALWMSLWNYHDQAEMESNVVDERHFASKFHCYDLDPEKPVSMINQNADEVRFYEFYRWRATYQDSPPEIVNLYTDRKE